MNGAKSAASIRRAVNIVRSAGLYVVADGYNVGEWFTLRTDADLDLWLSGFKDNGTVDHTEFWRVMRARRA